MRFGSLFAGIGGFDLGLERAGMTCAWQVEIDDFPRRVLEAHWPGQHRPRDVRDVGGDNLDAVELICGGFPCQDLSVAGKRAGLAGERSGLFYEFMRIVDEIAPTWVLIENVPGLLSSNGGRDMGAVLGTLAELGYWWAYRVLDAQYFGVAQRRRRVFIVGHRGDGRYPTQVLFEPESCAGDTPPSKKTRQVTASLLASGAGTNRPAGIGSETDFLVSHTVTKPLTTNETGNSKATRNAWYKQSAEMFGTAGFCYKAGAKAGGVSYSEKLSPTLKAGNHDAAVHGQFGVRRLTPTECERLQGFPDDWTAVDGAETPDTPRYKALGNAVCVNVAEWIGRRIVAIERAAGGC